MKRIKVKIFLVVHGRKINIFEMNKKTMESHISIFDTLIY